MHTYRKAKAEKLWTVGYFVDDEGKSHWEPLKDFPQEHQAIAFINYLNGGEARLETAKIFA
jgi:hypothetical protein